MQLKLTLCNEQVSRGLVCVFVRQKEHKVSKKRWMVKERHSFDSGPSPKLYFGALFRIIHEENHRITE